MRLIISTVVRNVPHTESSGYIYIVEWRPFRILWYSTIIEVPLSLRQAETNPRGGFRGAKGIAVRSDLIALSNSSSVFLYTPDWSFVREIAHPSCAGIHEFVFATDRIFVTSTQNDTICEFNFSGELIGYMDVRQQSTIRDYLNWKPRVTLSDEKIFGGEIDFRDPSSHELETYDNAHVNSIRVLNNGDMLISLGLILEARFLNLLRIKRWLIQVKLWNVLLELNRKLRSLLRMQKTMHSDLVVLPAKGRSAVVHISKDRQIRPLLVLDDKIVPSHSLLPVSDRCAIYLDTTNGHLVEFDLVTGDILASTKVTDGFLRGAYLLHEDKVLLGSDGDLLVFDLVEKKVLSRVTLTERPDETIFDIQCLPDHYALPPEDLMNL